MESIVLGTHLAASGSKCRVEAACLLTYGCSETITRVENPVTCGSADDLYRSGCESIAVGSHYTRLVQFSVSAVVTFDRTCSELSRSGGWRQCARLLSGAGVDSSAEAADRCDLEMSLPSGLTQDMVGYCCARRRFESRNTLSPIETPIPTVVAILTIRSRFFPDLALLSNPRDTLREGHMEGLCDSYRHKLLGMAVVLGFLGTGAVAETARDPGVRGGKASAGRPLPGLNLRERLSFSIGAQAFSSTRNVSQGLGPAFNGDSCVVCHSHPAAGGSSPLANPQFAVATRNGARNVVPSFLSPTGPVRVARFRYVPAEDGSVSSVRDGGVHALFSIAGRRDGGACDFPQPDFDRQLALGNLAFRIPTPTFGMGLIESIRDATILASFSGTAAARAALGIGGHPNRSRNDGTITRFGWKAQGESAELFSGEAYNVEMGITNQIMTQERTTRASCLLNPTPEDGVTLGAILSARALSAVSKFALFMRTLAPPSSGPVTASVTRGLSTFSSVGCVLCHTAALPIVGAKMPEVARQGQAMLFSDLMVHKMGPRLADDIVQGAAGPDEFRTAPLWGLGQRIYLLHDGRTTDLVEAIEAHQSPGDARFAPSEANAVVDRYRALSDSQKQDLLNFLRAL